MFYALIFFLVSFFRMDLFLYMPTVKMAISNRICSDSCFYVIAIAFFCTITLSIFLFVEWKRFLSLRQYAVRYLRLDLTYTFQTVIYLYTAYNFLRARCSKYLTAFHITSDKDPAICDCHWCLARGLTLIVTIILSCYVCAALWNYIFTVLSRQGFLDEHPRSTTFYFMLHKRLNNHKKPQIISDALSHQKEVNFDVHSTKNFSLHVQAFIILRKQFNSIKTGKVTCFPYAPNLKAVRSLVQARNFPNFQQW